MLTILPPKNAEKFACYLCDIKCSKQSDFSRHLLTRKHKQFLTPADFPPKNIDKILSCYCGKEYKHRQSLSVHKKTCKILLENTSEAANSKTEIVTEIEKIPVSTGLSEEFIMKLINQNNDMQKLILEQNAKMTDQNAKIIELISTQVQGNNAITKNTVNNNNNNNTTNNNFNLQIFLNETCKDALNLTDFVSSLQVKLKDLEETAKNGYTEGVSKIFINGLNDLEVNMRPIHCSDLKRETLYIKNDDKWTKESSEKSNITKAIKKVSNKNIQQIFEWQKKYPEYNNSESKQNDRYQEMLFTAMGGSTDEEQLNNFDKIIRNITKEVVIDKTA